MSAYSDDEGMERNERVRMIWEVTPKGRQDFSEVVVALANERPVDLSGYDIRWHSSPESLCRQQIIDAIRHPGVSEVWRRQNILEALIAPKQASQEIVSLLHGFLGSIQVTTHLIVVDPYFLARTREDDYPDVIAEVLTPFAPGLSRMDIVTQRPDEATRTEVSARLKRLNASLTMRVHISKDFHDRFWINPIARRGFLSGTSLNGLGKRYALLDFIHSVDLDGILEAVAEVGVHIDESARRQKEGEDLDPANDA